MKGALFRSLEAPDAPWVTPLWKGAAQALLDDHHSPEHQFTLEALFYSERLRLYWREVERRALAYQLDHHGLERHPRNRRCVHNNVRGMQREILFCLVTRGGIIPKVSAGELRKQRQKVAAAARRLAAALEADPYAHELLIANFLESAGLELQGQVESLTSPLLADLVPTLRAFAENAEGCAPLVDQDQAIFQKPPYRGRNPQRSQLERTLHHVLFHATGRPHDAFVAGAVSVVLEVDATPEEVGQRRRARDA